MSINDRRQMDRLMRSLTGALGNGGKRLGGTSGHTPRPYVQTPQTVQFYRAQVEVARMLELGPGPVVLSDGSTVQLPRERRFTELSEISDYVADLAARPWPGFEHRQGDPCHVRTDPDAGYAVYTGGWIRIPDKPNLWAWRELVVLHELAHHLLSPTHHHEPPFGRAHRMLMSHTMGPEVDYLYGVIMNKHGVQL